jgi:DNA polymerase-1
VNDAQDHTMANVILSGQDLYTYFAQVVFNDPSINKDDPRRGMFKVMVLAFFYGAGVKRLALITDQTEAEVYEQLRTLFYHFPSVAEMTGDKAIGGSNAGKFARIAGERLAAEGLAYIHTTGGRRFSMESDALYKAVNGRMQGSGADCLKDAMIRLDAAGYADNIIIMVHDEVIFQFPDGEDGALAAKEASLIMEDHSFHVPLLTEMKGPLTDWGASYR